MLDPGRSPRREPFRHKWKCRRAAAQASNNEPRTVDAENRNQKGYFLPQHAHGAQCGRHAATPYTGRLPMCHRYASATLSTTTRQPCALLCANTKSHDGHILHASSPHTIRVNPDLPTAAPPIALASRYALAPPAIHVTQKRTPRGPCHGCLATHGVDVVDDHPERQHTSRLHTHEAGTAPRRRECAARGVSHHTVPLLHPGGALVTHSSMRQVIHGQLYTARCGVAT